MSRKVMNAAQVLVGTLEGSFDPYPCDVDDRVVRNFVLVDEAGQATELATLFAINQACTDDGRVILIGDHRQLAPTVTDYDADFAGLGTSMFERFTRFTRHRLVHVVHPVQDASHDLLLAQQRILHGDVKDR